MLLLQPFVGDLSKWLITTWDQISNNGAAYGDNSPRKVLKSSDRATCTFFLLRCLNPLVTLVSTAVDRKWRNNNGVAAEPWISL